MDEYVPSFGSEVRVSKRLEHNSSKNVSKRPAFVWQTQIQTIEYGLNNKILKGKKEVIDKQDLNP